MWPTTPERTRDTLRSSQARGSKTRHYSPAEATESRCHGLKVRRAVDNFCEDVSKVQNRWLSTPTTAMKHLVCGLPYQIPFCSRQDFQFAPDVGAATALSAWESFANYGVFTLPSHTLESQQIVEVISNVASEIDYLKASEISVGDERVPFICDLEFKAFLSQFPGVPHTSIEDGIRRTLETFHRQHQAGWLRIES